MVNVTVENLSVPPRGDFMRALANALHPSNPVQIRFLSCYTGQGQFLTAFIGSLNALGIRNINVEGVQQYYNMTFQANNGVITRWQDQHLASPHRRGHVSGSRVLSTGRNNPDGTVSNMNRAVPPVSSPITYDPLEGLGERGY